MTNEEFIRSISFDGEEWRDIAGYENRYMVSNKGRIICLSLDIVTHPHGKEQIIHRDAHLLKPSIFKSGYLYIMFRKDGKRNKYTIHRLVAQAFIPNIANYPQIDHKDGNKQNNDINNLRWCTPTINMSNELTQQRVLIGREKVDFPYRMPIVQLINGKIVNSYDSIYSTKDKGYNPASVNKCCNGKCKTYKGYSWMRLSDYETLVSMSKNSTDSPIG